MTLGRFEGYHLEFKVDDRIKPVSEIVRFHHAVCPHFTRHPEWYHPTLLPGLFCFHSASAWLVLSLSSAQYI